MSDPNVTMSQTAEALKQMQEQMAAARKQLAENVAKETKQILDRTTEEAKTVPVDLVTEFPTPNSNYLAAAVAAAAWRTLRDQLVNAHVRNEGVQADRAILNQRMDEGTFRSDVERAAADRSLAYYEVLEERLQEIEHLLSLYKRIYDDACAQQHRDDEDRQQDVPSDERRFVTMPQLRWVSNADKAANPTGWEEADDLARLADRAEFAISFTSGS